MHDGIKFRIERMQQCAAQITQDLEWIGIWDDCVSLAHRERTGKDLPPGGKYSEVDRERADELVKLFPVAGSSGA
jgi:hypothetical protein